jgi:hypothetical protein
MNSKKGVVFNCFSPPVMVATLTVEFFLAAYTVWRYKMTPLTRLIAGTLVALATFQLAEYFVCTGYGLHAMQWSRLGFVAITTLPPLGLHILHNIAGKPEKKLVAAAYGSMAAFIIFFMSYPTAFIGHQCTGNYVIFQIGYKMGGLYGAYYYGWLFTALFLGLRWGDQLKTGGKKALRKIEAIRGLQIGYLVFLVPTALANTVKPETRRGIPSVMCGFAVLFALILTLYVLPRMVEAKQPAGPLPKKST